MSGFHWWPWRNPQPAPPRGFVFFTTAKGNPMNLNVNVSLQPPDPVVVVARRTVSIKVNGGTPIVLDGLSGHVSAPCQANDQIDVSVVDTSAGGKDSQPATWSGIAVDNVTVPATPVFSVSFTPAPVGPA